MLSSIVEGHFSRLCLYLDCFLYAVVYSLRGINLAMHVLGDFSKGLVVFGAIACIRLLWPSQTLCCNSLFCLCQLAKLRLLAKLLWPIKCILAGTSTFTLRSIVFGTKIHFLLLQLIELLYICLDRLILMLFTIRVNLLEREPETISV